MWERGFGENIEILGVRLLENLAKLNIFVWRASLLVLLVPISKFETPHKSQPPINSYHRLVRINPEHQVYALAYMARLLGICLKLEAATAPLRLYVHFTGEKSVQTFKIRVFWFSLRVLVSDQGLAAGLYQLLVGVVFVNSDGWSPLMCSTDSRCQVGMLMLSCVGLTCRGGALSKMIIRRSYLGPRNGSKKLWWTPKRSR